MSYIERFDKLKFKMGKRKAYVRSLFSKKDYWDIDYVIDHEAFKEATTNQLPVPATLVIPQQV